MKMCRMLFVGFLLTLLFCPTEISTYRYSLRKKGKRVSKSRTYKDSEYKGIEVLQVPAAAEVPEEEFYLDAQSCARRFRPNASKDNFPSLSSKFSTSVCLRCGICLAIALRVNYTFNMATANQRTEKRFEPSYVFQLLESLCDYGFENYELRSYDGNVVVMEALLLTEHVPTAMDGEWTRQLRSKCHFYVKEYGAMKLYNAWLYGSIYPARDMVNALCRSGGMFRDCFNVKDKQVIIPEYRRRGYLHCTVEARVPCAEQ